MKTTKEERAEWKKSRAALTGYEFRQRIYHLIADVEDAVRLLGISKETLDEFEKADHSWEGREAWWYEYGLTTRRALANFLKEPKS